MGGVMDRMNPVPSGVDGSVPTCQSGCYGLRECFHWDTQAMYHRSARWRLMATPSA